MVYSSIVLFSAPNDLTWILFDDRKNVPPPLKKTKSYMRKQLKGSTAPPHQRQYERRAKS